MSSFNKPIPVMAFLGLGSNVDPKINFIDTAVKDLQRIFPLEFRVSSYYGTKPYKGLKQDSYVNCCVVFRTSEPAQKILRQTRLLEKKIGRVRSYNPWESREIDIDILLYGGEKYRMNNLIIPHYDLSKRDFFLIPLIELDKNLVNPSSGISLVEELGSLSSEAKTMVGKIDAMTL